MLFNNELLSTYGHTNYQENDRYGFALSYSYPLNVKFKTVRRGLHISRENGNSSSGWNQKQLLFFSDRKIKKTTSFHVGFQQRYFGIETYELEEYGIVDMEQYIQDLDVQYPPGYINQLLDQNYFRLFSNVTFLALGTRMTRTFASEVALKREGEIYTGMEHTIFRFGANFLFGLSSSIHTAEISGMPSKGVKKTVDYKRLGIAFSFSGLGLTKVRALGFNTSFGFHPGHYLKAKDAFFFRMGINIGLGRLWNP